MASEASLILESPVTTDIERYERISLNNLLIKSKGAPYEDALRRIINLRLSVKSSRDDHQISRDDAIKNREICGSRERRYESTAPLNSDDRLAEIPSSNPESQLLYHQKCESLQHSHKFEANYTDYEESSSSRCSVSASAEEFQKWLYKNEGCDLHHEDQCQSWLRHISSSGSESHSPRDNIPMHLGKDKGNQELLNSSKDSNMKAPSKSRNSSIQVNIVGTNAKRANQAPPTRREENSVPVVRDEGRAKLRPSLPLSSSSRSRNRDEAGSRNDQEHRSRISTSGSTTPRSVGSSSKASDGEFQMCKTKNFYDDKWQQISESRPFRPNLLAQKANKRILGTCRSSETFDQRNAQSVQNYYIRQAFSINDRAKGVGMGAPAVGQYTKSLTLPYNQRHSKTINDADVTVGRKGRNHTFGDEVYKDSFMQQSFSQSSALNSVDGDGMPGVGQYTKAVVLPYDQRHSRSATQGSKSPSATRRHTWGNERYDAFNLPSSDVDAGHCGERFEGAATHSSSPSSSSCGSRPSAFNAPRSRSASRDRDGRRLPRTPSEQHLRHLLHKISVMGASTATATPLPIRGNFIT